MNKRIVAIIISVLWLIVIFSFSGKVSFASQKQSMGTLESLIKFSSKVLNMFSSSRSEFTKEQILNLVDKYHFLFRKSCHFLVYLILGLLVALTISLFSKPTFFKVVILATMICLVYSLLDEYHQTMVVGRVGSIIDCIIDTSGAMVGSGLYYLAYRIKQLKK